MKSEALKHLSRISAAVLASALAVASTVPASAQSDESVAPLTGTWRVKVTQYNCATGMTLLWFWSVLSFQPGGTESETTSNPALQPGQRTPGYGFWKPARDSAFCSSESNSRLFQCHRGIYLVGLANESSRPKKGCAEDSAVHNDEGR